VGHTKKMSSA